MIENERQYQITLNRVRLLDDLISKHKKTDCPANVDPFIYEAELRGYLSLQNELKLQCEEYYQEYMKGLKICGRCYGVASELFEPKCSEKPENLIDQPIGQYHCPDCGAMLVAGLKHPFICAKCRDRRHPGFDE